MYDSWMENAKCSPNQENRIKKYKPDVSNKKLLK